MAIEITVFSGFSYIETFGVRRTFGFSNASPIDFVLTKVRSLIFFMVMYLPVILITVKCIETFKDDLVLAIIVATFFVKVGIVWLFPFVKRSLLEEAINEFPEDALPLKDKIIELAEAVDYPTPS